MNEIQREIHCSEPIGRHEWAILSLALKEMQARQKKMRSFRVPVGGLQRLQGRTATLPE